jgi:sulfur relay (sulfurtransferase) DsrF/TusC family protein
VDGFNASALVAAVFSESPYAFSNVYDAFKIAFARPNEIASEHAALDYRLQ